MIKSNLNKTSMKKERNVILNLVYLNMNNKKNLLAAMLLK